MPIERINVVDYKLFGQMVVKWATDPTSRPQTLQQFKDATQGVLELPDRITEDPQYVQWSLSNLLIRLPDPKLVQQSIEMLQSQTGQYPTPQFYGDLLQTPSDIAPVDGLFNRVGDYTIAQCM